MVIFLYFHFYIIEGNASIFAGFLGVNFPVDNFGTVVGENPTPYGSLALWAVNGLSIVYWVPRKHFWDPGRPGLTMESLDFRVLAGQGPKNASWVTLFEHYNCVIRI